MKKRKPEVLLSDVFKAMKPSRVYHFIGNKAYTTQYRERLVEDLENKLKGARQRPHNWYPEFTGMFFFTKPITGLTKKDAEKMFDSYASIRWLRNKRLDRTPMIINTLPKLLHDIWDRAWAVNMDRLWPLPFEKYQEIAKKIYEKRGAPKFYKSRLDKIVFGRPETQYNYKKHILEKRTVGVEILRNKEKGKMALGVHIADEEHIYFTHKELDHAKRRKGE
jgi:hypothetical protein